MVYSSLILVSRQVGGVSLLRKKKKGDDDPDIRILSCVCATDSTRCSKGGGEILTGSFTRVVPLLPHSGLFDLAESRQFHRQSGSDASQYITNLFNLQARLARFANIQMAPLMEPSFHHRTSTGLASKWYNGSECSKRDIHLPLTHSM